MILTEVIDESIKSLYYAKQRTLLALIGIMIGIGSVIAMISIGTIVENEALKAFREMGTDVLTIRKRYSPSNKHNKEITLDMALSIPRLCKSVKYVAPYISSSADVSFKGKKSYGSIYGITESFKKINKLPLLKGRFISDLDGLNYYCVLGMEKFAELRLLGLKEPIGKKIRVNNRLFTVVGVIKNISVGGMRSYGLNKAIFIPIPVAYRILKDPHITEIMVKTDSSVHYTIIKQNIFNYFKQLLGKNLIDIRSAEEIIKQMEKQMQLFTLMLGAIGSISLLVGGIGIMNVMLTSIMERRKEIGIRRAIGARKKDILIQFISESIILCLIGGVIGIVLGMSCSYVVAKIFKWDFLVSYPAIVLGFGVSSIIGLFFGFYPAYQAAKLDPITVLRTE